MEVKASAKYLRISPRKLRLVSSGLRGLVPRKALEKLQFRSQDGADLLIKLIKQAVANAVSNFKQTEESLKIKKIEVGEGPRFKRMDKSHGARFDRGIIKKKTAHLYLTLEAREVKPMAEDKVINKLAKEKSVPEETNPPSLKLRRARGTKS